MASDVMHLYGTRGTLNCHLKSYRVQPADNLQPSHLDEAFEMPPAAACLAPEQMVIDRPIHHVQDIVPICIGASAGLHSS